MELVGWISNCLFAFASVPQVYKCWKQKHARGVSFGLLSMWIVGEGLGLFYGLHKQLPLPILFNYCINLLCISIIIYYWIKGVRSERKEVQQG